MSHFTFSLLQIVSDSHSFTELQDYCTLCETDFTLSFIIIKQTT